MQKAIIIFEAMKISFPKFLEKYKEQLKGRTGVYVIIYYQGQIFGGVIGHLTDENTPIKMGFAMEKLTRVIIRHNNDFDDLSSYKTHDPENGKYGGCVYAGGMYISISGLPPVFDHLYAVDTFVEQHITDEGGAQLINLEVPEEDRALVA